VEGGCFTIESPLAEIPAGCRALFRIHTTTLIYIYYDLYSSQSPRDSKRYPVIISDKCRPLIGSTSHYDSDCMAARGSLEREDSWQYDNECHAPIRVFSRSGSADSEKLIRCSSSARTTYQQLIARALYAEFGQVVMGSPPSSETASDCAALTRTSSVPRSQCRAALMRSVSVPV